MHKITIATIPEITWEDVIALKKFPEIVTNFISSGYAPILGEVSHWYPVTELLAWRLARTLGAWPVQHKRCAPSCGLYNNDTCAFSWAEHKAPIKGMDYFQVLSPTHHCPGDGTYSFTKD